VNLPRVLAAAAAALAQAALAAGFAAAGSRAGLVASLALALGWALAIALPAPDGPPLCLAGSTLLAVLGILAGAPPRLVWLGAAAALAAWDLALFTRKRSGPLSPGERRLERAHLWTLAAGLVPGLLLPFALGRVELRLPFLAVAGAAIAAAVALHRVARMLG
jgi:hypothetical protein